MRRVTTVLALTLAATGAFPPGPAVSAETLFFDGAGVSTLPEDIRRLTVHARVAADDTTSGRLAFTHRSSAGLAEFTGEVTCLAESAGAVQVSGIISKGTTSNGTVLDGRPVAFTVTSGDGGQRFTLPLIGDAVQDCGGGRPEFVDVDHGGFQVH